VNRRGAVVAALVLLALLAQTVRAHHRLRADRLLGAVRLQLALAQQRGSLPLGLVRGASAALAEARELAPAAVEPRAFEGDLLLLLGRPGEAIAAYADAIAHEPRPETLLHLGLAEAAQGDRAAAVREWRRALALSPWLAGEVPAGAAGEVAAAPLEPLPAGGRFQPPG
jgi:tetratricopeptide (TPR) repeat protein